MAEVTLTEAATLLGITREAVRSRVRRKLLDGRKRADGIWVVTIPDHDLPTGTTTVDDRAAPAAAAETVAALREALAALREQLTMQDRQLLAREREVQELHVLLQNTQRLIPATVPDAPQAAERPGGEESRGSRAERRSFGRTARTAGIRGATAACGFAALSPGTPSRLGVVMSRRTAYQPLLDDLAASDDREVVLTLDQIEAILDAALPDTAYTHGGYWTEEGSAHVRRWRAMGWRARLDRRNRCVHFTREQG